MAELRFTLGKVPDGDNILDGSFEGAPVTEGSVTQTGITTPGLYYRVELDYSTPSPAPGQGVAIGIGDLSSRWLGATPGHYIYENVCISGDAITIYINGAGVLNNVVAYLLKWDQVLQNEPMGSQDGQDSIDRKNGSLGLIRGYTPKLTFWGDGYRYINDYYLTNGQAATLPALIEEKCNGEFSTVFEGLIFISDCIFDVQRCTIEIEVHDRGASQLLTAGKDVEVPFINIWRQADIDLVSSEIGALHPGFTDNGNFSAQLHDITGTYPSFGFDNYRPVRPYVYDVWLSLKRLLEEATDSSVTAVSDFFTSVALQNDIILSGRALINAGNGYNKIIKDMSFSRYFTELNKLYNLDYSVEYNDGIPCIRIEPKTYYQTGGANVALTRIADLKFKFDNKKFYHVVNIGYKDKDQQDLNAADKTKGYAFQYVSSTKSATEVLDLTSEFIGDSNIILNQLATGVSGDDYGFADNIYYIMCLESRISLQYPQDDGSVFYNPNLIPQQMMARQAETLNGDDMINTQTGERVELQGVTARVFSFTAPITRAQFNTLNSPAATVTFPYQGGTLTGILNSVKRNLKDGMADFEVLAP